jgi:tripartite-type tricarboxylate transporter receptor subunit TctC
LQDLIDQIKAKPGEIAVAVIQMGGSHAFMLYLQQELGLDFIIIPYSSGGEQLSALLGRHVDVSASSVSSCYAMGNQARCIAIGMDERSILFPDTPTVLEATSNKELSEVVKSLAIFRGLLVSQKFKNDYPERFEKLLAAYDSAFHSKEYMAEAERTGQTGVLHWTGPEEADKLSAEADRVILEYAKYFK